MSFCHVLPQIGDNQRANSASTCPPLQMPSAIGSNTACRQLFRILVIRIGSQDPVDDAASTVSPLQAAALDTSVSESKPLFRLPPLMGELDKKFINDSPLL